MAQIWEIASTDQLRNIEELLDNLDAALAEALTVDEYDVTIATVRALRDTASRSLDARERLKEIDWGRGTWDEMPRNVT